MSARIVQCKADRGYNLWIRFADGLQGSVHVGNLTDIGAFKLWRDMGVFLNVRPERDTGDLHWPTGGIRLSHEILYEDIKAGGGKYGPPAAAPSATIDPGFYRFMASALVPVKLESPRKRRKK